MDLPPIKAFILYLSTKTGGSSRGRSKGKEEGKRKPKVVYRRIKTKHGHLRHLSCTYRITTVMTLRYFAVMKQQYNSMSFSQGSVPRGRMKEGTPTLRKCELGAMYMQDLLPSVRDSVISSDLVTKKVCGICRTLRLNCTCSGDERSYPKEATICARRPFVIFDVMHTIWQMNSRFTGIPRDSRTSMDEVLNVLTYD